MFFIKSSSLEERVFVKKASWTEFSLLSLLYVLLVVKQRAVKFKGHRSADRVKGQRANLWWYNGDVVWSRTTAVTTAHGGSADDVELDHVRHYQVYRGMSPNTSNRLEVSSLHGPGGPRAGPWFSVLCRALNRTRCHTAAVTAHGRLTLKSSYHVDSTSVTSLNVSCVIDTNAQCNSFI